MRSISQLCGAGLLAGALASSPAAAQPAPASGPVLDTFLRVFTDCDLSTTARGGFEAFWRSLVEKYANDFSEQAASARVKAEVVLAIPAAAKAAVGAASSVNHGEYTEVKVPLAGSVKGIPVSALVFSLGNENGISAARLVFAAPLAQVEKAFGASIARGNRKGVAAGREGAGYTAAIPKEEPGSIVCDWSN